ncbi:MAG: diadenylate cyclase CdaA, partial [Clostridia bacterium]|nr:diadenylate cyclase CdaA [Clostridia bacterium]
ATGVIMFILVLVLCELFGMRTMQYIFQNIFQVGIVALLILFQPELRSALEKMGAGSIKGIMNISDKNGETMLLAIRETVIAVGELAASKTGALIVFERNTKLGEIAATGTVIDAQTGSFLLRNIFFNKAPLHDGAVLISKGRIHSAGCLLPLSNQNDINRDLGTRHRAALGLSESCDAVVIVVSEETGIVSVAVDGELRRGYNPDTLRAELTSLLIHTSDNQKVRRRRSPSSKNSGKEERESED